MQAPLCTFLDNSSCRSSVELLPWAITCLKFSSSKPWRGCPCGSSRARHLRTTLQQVQGCGVIHQTLLFEEYDAVNMTPKLKIVKSWFLSCSVLTGPPKSITMVVPRCPWVNAQSQVPQVTLLVPETATQSFTFPFFFLHPSPRMCICMGSKQTRMWCFEIERETRPDSLPPTITSTTTCDTDRTDILHCPY